SISTPVCAVVSAAASIATPSPSTVRSTSTTVSGSGWQSGISSPVRFAAWIPAMRATVRASPFGSDPRRAVATGACRRRRPSGHHRSPRRRARARSPERLPCQMDESTAVVDGGADARSGTVRVQRAEEPSQPVDRAVAVRVPPARGQPAAVGVDELDVRQRIEPVARAGAPEAGAAPPAPGRLRGPERVRVVVVPHAAGLESIRDRARTGPVAAPDAGAETERRVVRPAHHRVVGVQLDNDRGRTEELLAGQPRVARLAQEQCRLGEPAGKVGVGPAAAGRDVRSVLDRVRDEALEPSALLLADERPELDTGIAAAADPQLASPRREALDERVVEARRDGDPLDARACLTAVRVDAPERALDGP